MKFYNTLTKKLEEFQTVEPGQVKMYVCGPTVYDYFHIGNARPFIIFDSLRRYLEYRGYHVTYAQNITDVDDKIINKSAADGISADQVAQKYSQAYLEDLESLGVLPANFQPKATEQIPEMVKFIEDLIKKGFAYESGSDVFFRVKRFKGYGKLSKKSINELQAGARVEVNESKEDPLDFALWKSAKPGEPHWPSPWGEGRPGWHLECSVMSMGILGETFDIHGGGTDLIFPHHENEIAQSEANTGRPFVRFWLHNELLNFKGEKMSKSLGNFAYARDIIEKYGREAVRFFYLCKHYRSPMSFSHELMADAKRAVERIENVLKELHSHIQSQDGGPVTLDSKKLTKAGQDFWAQLERAREDFIQNLDDDFNTAGGMGVIFELVTQTNIFRQKVAAEDRALLKAALDLFRELGGPLGLFQDSPSPPAGGELQERLIQLLISVRNDLRAKKEFELSDKIRDQLEAMGVELKDKDKETLWSYS